MKAVDYSAVANSTWRLWQNDNGNYDLAYAKLAVLMDIRAELRHLNGLLNCSNFLSIPHTLRSINKHIVKPTRKAKKK